MIGTDPRRASAPAEDDRVRARLSGALPALMKIVTRSVPVRSATVVLGLDDRRHRCAWRADGGRIAARVPVHAARAYTYLTGDADRTPPARPRQIALPLVTTDGHLLGVVHFQGTRRVDERDLLVLNATAVQVAALVAREREEGAQVAVLMRLRDRLLERDELFNAVIHALGSPLAVIDVNARSLIASAAAKDPTVRRSVEHIAASAQEISALVGDLLEAGRPAATATRVPACAQFVRALVNDVVAALAPLARARSQRLTAEVRGPRGLAVACDARRLRKVFDSLIGNAIKYTPERGAIQVRAGARGNDAWFSVTDNGPGIPRRDHPRIFRAFSRGETAGDVRGFGLGLHIARRIIEAAGGELSVRSRPGAGSTFSFTLPRAPHPSAERPMPRSATAHTLPSAGSGARTGNGGSR